MYVLNYSTPWNDFTFLVFPTFLVSCVILSLPMYCLHLLSAHIVSLLSTLCTLTRLTFTIITWGGYYFLLPFQFYKWRHILMMKLRNWPKVSQIISGKAWTQTQAIWLQSWWFLPLYYGFHWWLSGNLPAKVKSLSWENPLKREMTTHSSILVWEIPWREEPGRLQSIGSQRVRHNLVS